MRSESLEARERCGEALEAARAAGARDEEAEALGYLGSALCVPRRLRHGDRQPRGGDRPAPRARSASTSADAIRDRLHQLDDSSLPLGGPPARIQADAALCVAEASRARGGSATGDWHQGRDAAIASGNVARTAYANWRLAESALKAGDRDEAHRALADAARTAARIGHVPLLREIDDLARRGRIRIEDRAPTTSGIDRFLLTPREHEVLLLLAERDHQPDHRGTALHLREDH
jgi:hypothetical protein